MQTSLLIFKHELKKILNDKKLLASMILVPIFVVFFMSFLTSIATETTQTSDPIIYSLNNVAIGESFQTQPVEYSSLEDLKNNIELSPSDVVLDISGESVIIYYNELDANSCGNALMCETFFCQNITYEVLKSSEPFEIFFNDTNNEIEINNILAATMLPYMLVLLLFQNTSNYAIDTIAGEKERGVFAKTLLAPVSPAPVIIGKILSSTICGIISCLFYFAITLVSEHVLGQDSFGLRNANLGIGMILGIFLCSSILCYLVATLGVFCSLKTKNVKEAQDLSKIIFVLCTIASLMSIFRAGVLPSWNYFIPVYNICILIQDILYSIVDINKILIVIASFSACSVIVSLLTINVLKKETINY
jgi:sodium transport system permease protein